MQPGLGGSPITHYRIGRDREHLRGLFHAEAPEITHFHDPALPRMQSRQRSERIVERDQFTRTLRKDHSLVEGYRLVCATALRPVARAGMVHKDMAHGCGC